MTLRVVLIEPWYGGSHRIWADGVVAHSRHEVHLLTLPGRHWRWRMRGAAVTLAEQFSAHVAVHGRPDVVVVSGMVDLAALLGLCRSSIGDVPVGLYLHENQIVWPHGPARRPGDPSGWRNWSSMVAASRVWLNSAFHRHALLAALPAFLAQAPDEDHLHRLDEVAGRCRVLPVGVDTVRLRAGTRTGAEVTGAAPLVVWNQRWDDDKDPDRLMRILGRLADEGMPFRLAVAGGRGRRRADDDAALRERFGPRLVQLGPLARDRYEALLLAGDVVVSVARHEFFGVAVVEAVAAGCVPLLPARLSYPELLPDWSHPRCLWSSAPADRLRGVLADLASARAAAGVERLREAMARWDATTVAPLVDAELEDLAGSGP